MIEQLPIIINASNELTTVLPQLNAVTNRLEAQFNFQSMLANWYGDEYSILFIQLLLETPQGFTALKEKQKEMQQTKQVETFKTHSDDVFSFIDDNDPQQLICTIAITEFEQNLLDQQAKLLGGLLQIKLQKVLNIIAKQLNLKPI